VRKGGKGGEKARRNERDGKRREVEAAPMDPPGGMEGAPSYIAVCKVAQEKGGKGGI